MSEKQKIAEDLEKNTADLIAHLSPFTNENYTLPPAEGKWSAAEVTEHIILLDKIANRILQGPGKPTDRQPGEKLNNVSAILSDMERQLNSPDFIEPKGIIKTKEEGLEMIKHGREKMQQTIQAHDMAEICLAEKHPAFGAFTRMEWVYFIISHCNRHLVQLETIANAVAVV